MDFKKEKKIIVAGVILGVSFFNVQSIDKKFNKSQKKAVLKTVSKKQLTTNFTGEKSELKNEKKSKKKQVPKAPMLNKSQIIFEDLKKTINKPSQEKAIKLFLDNFGKSVSQYNNKLLELNNEAIEKELEEGVSSYIGCIIEEGIFDSKKSFYKAAYDQEKDPRIQYILSCQIEGLSTPTDFLLKRQKKQREFAMYCVINDQLNAIKTRNDVLKVSKKIDDEIDQIAKVDKQFERKELYEAVHKLAKKSKNSLVIFYVVNKLGLEEKKK